MQKCISCGRTFENKTNSELCPKCLDDSGTVKNQSQILNELAEDLCQELGISQKKAIEMAKANLLNSPHWVKKLQIFNNKKHIVITDVGSTTTKALLLSDDGNGFKIKALSNAATTVEKPNEDVKIGMKNALKKIEEQTGLQLFNEEHNKFEDNTIYITTSSAGGGLQIVVIGLTNFDSASSGKRTAYGAGGVLLDTFAIDDKRTALEQMQDMKSLHPDIVLMAGGVNGGAFAPILRMGELLSLADPKPKFGQAKTPLVFAGNEDVHDFISSMFAEKFDLYLEENIRPTMARENLTPAREKIHQLFLESVMEQAPGYSGLKKISADEIIPTPLGVIRSLQILSKESEKNIVAVDIGGATTDIFSNISGYYFRTVSANFGMSYSISNVMAEAGFDKLMKVLPDGIDENYVRNYIANKTLYPIYVPNCKNQQLIERAVCILALQMALKQHLEMNFNNEKVGFLDKLKLADIEKYSEAFYFERESEKKRFYMHEIDMLIGAGGIISHTNCKITALKLISDGLQAQGITQIKRDKYFISPHLGKLSQVNEGLAKQLLTTDCFEDLGYSLKPIAKKVKTGKGILKIAYENGESEIINEGQTKIIEGKACKIYSGKGFYLKKDETEFSFDGKLPVYIDCRFINHESHFENEKADISLEEAFTPLLNQAKVEQGEFLLNRELPYNGIVELENNQNVTPESEIGKNLYQPPKIYVISLFEKAYLHLNKDNIRQCLKITEGQELQPGQLMVDGRSGSFLEKFSGQQPVFQCPVRGRVEKINHNSGTIVMREIQDYSRKPITINVAKRLNIKPKQMGSYLKHHEGEFVYAGQNLASKLADAKVARNEGNRIGAVLYNKGMTMNFVVTVPQTGRIEKIDYKTGEITIKNNQKPFILNAGIYGKIEEVVPQLGANIKYTGARFNGIIGFGKPKAGKLVIVENADELKNCKDCITVFKNKIDLNILQQAEQQKVKGVIAPAINNQDLIDFTNKEIGVALTGNEDIPLALIITQGFGNFVMHNDLYEFLKSKQGTWCYVDGKTQIRAGVVRPVVVVSEK